MAPARILGSIPGLPFAGILTAAGAMALLVTQLKGASEDASVFEELALNMDRFTASTEDASSILEGLQKFSGKSMFSSNTLQTTASGLLGAGVRDNVQGLTEDLAALAKDDSELKSLGHTMGKIFQKGNFTSGDLDSFLEHTINLLPALEAQTGKSGEAFK